MSCLDELTLSIHADGELSETERHDVVAHLEACGHCRTRLRRLQMENATLMETLRAEEAVSLGSSAWDAVVARAGVVSPNVSAARWIVGAVALATLTPLLLDWVWQTVPTLPPGFRWLGTLGGLSGFYSMASGVAPLFVGGQDMLLSSFGFVATLFVVIAMLGFAALRRHPLAATTAAVGLALFAALAPPSEARAAEFRYEEDGTVKVDEGETIDDTVFLGGKTAIVAGIVDGDVFAAAERVEVTGEISGNLYAAGGSVSIGGVVDGNAHVAGKNVELDAKVGGSGFVAGQTVTLTEGSELARTAFLAGESVRSRGLVGRDLYFAGEELELIGRVEHNAHGYGNEVAVTSSGTVGGDLHLTVTSEDGAQVDDGATIGGATDITVHEREEHRAFLYTGFYVGVVLKTLALLLLGFVLVTLFPSLTPKAPTSSKEVLRDMGVGFVALIATPFLVLLVAFTIIGIPISALLAVGYLLLTFLASLVVAYFAGQRIPAFGEGGAGVALRTGLALLVILLVTQIPFIGGGLCFVILIFGLGCLVMHLWSLYLARQRPEATA